MGEVNVFWNYGTVGAKISAGVAAVGIMLNMLLGGYDKILGLLVFLMLADFILGILSAIKAKKLNSKAMLWGGVNKILVLLIVALAVRLDCALPIKEPYIRCAVIWFYCGREGLSLVENYGKMGMPLPSFIVKILEQLKTQGEEGGVKR